MKYCIAVIFILNYVSTFCQENELIGYNLNKCYDFSLLNEKVDTIKTTIFEYTGEDFNNEYICQELIITTPKTNKWVKLPKTNCLLPNKEDCLVWTLAEIPETSQEIYIVKDTSKVKDFIIRTVYTLFSKADFSRYEIVCSHLVTPSLITKIKKSLFYEGFSIKINGAIDDEFWTTLIKFQEKKKLRPRALDYETLRILKIKIE
jgi:hypothetical protein